jgi:hypothetical protein
VSLVVNLAVLAEGAAPDARGTLTLVAVNPHALIAEELPAQFGPVFVAVIEDDEDAGTPQVLTSGAAVNAKVQVTGPDGEALFMAQFRPMVVPPPHPGMRPRIQVVAQVPFTAAKTGKYAVSADFEVVGDRAQEPNTITALRVVRVIDRASLAAKPTD